MKVQKDLINNERKTYVLTLPWPVSKNNYLGHATHPDLPRLLKQLQNNITYNEKSHALNVLGKIWKLFRYSKPFVKEEGRIFKEHVAWIVKSKKWHNLGQTELLGYKLKVTTFCYPPDNRRRDIGNLDYCLMDALQDSGMIRDDCDIWNNQYIRKEVVPGGKVKVVIETME